MTVLSAGARKPMLGTHYQGASMNVIRMESADKPSPVIGEHTGILYTKKYQKIFKHLFKKVVFIIYTIYKQKYPALLVPISV